MNTLKNIIFTFVLLGLAISLSAQNTGQDTTNLKYPFNDDSRTNPFGQKTSPLYGNTPSNIKEEVKYNPKTNTYTITRKVGDLNYSFPETMTIEQYRKHISNKSIRSYWQNRWKGDAPNTGVGSFLNRKFSVGGEAFESIFGANTVEIHPQGSAELIFGLKIQNTENPTLQERNRRNTTFEFDEKIQMNVTGKIGDAITLGINYDTEATFDFENKTKLAYEGKEDDIIQKIEAGDVTLPLSGSLISGSQSLFGFKTELKFGKLTVTSVFSQQKGKRSEIEVQGGSQVEEFEVYASDYEANKHFFLSQYFYENYDRFLENTNIIRSPVQITQIEVWVTNKTGNFEDVRNIVGFMDLGENAQHVYNQTLSPSNAQLPFNAVNSLDAMKEDLSDWNNVNNFLSGRFDASIDYEKVESARMLRPNEYTINKQLGYISLNSRLNPDEVLAVAFEYTAYGETYRVGELTSNAKPSPSPLILKLLKGTSVSPNLPRWKLMMKNIYPLGAYQLDRNDFELHVLYKNDKTGTAMNYIDVGNIKGDILLNVMGLDKLNSQNDPIPEGDGAFDFVEGITINRAKGRIIFPVVEPFGSHLKREIGNDNIAEKYIYEELYNETQNVAKQEVQKNKFVLKGKYQSSSGSDISLNALNVPQGSVTVSAGGRTLVEGSDYTVDYSLGRVKILNQGLLESGTPIKISLESHSLFSMQTKTMVGTHLNYKFSDNFNIGGTLLNLSEKPLTQKVNQGDEPINNTIWGLNSTYSTDAPILTKMVDAIPFIETKEKSTVTINGEFAQLIPGHSKAISDGGHAYIDDFEGSTTKLDQKYFSTWHLSSIPKDSILFPSSSNTGLGVGKNRAKLAWYVIDNTLVRELSETPSHLKGTDEQKKFFVKEVYETDLWPERDLKGSIPMSIPVLNVAFYPKERGPYNFDATNVKPSGELENPESRWGGIQRELATTDFEESNIEYIEFWLMDPFVYDNGQGRTGDIYFNLGDVSEDILKDSRKSFEEGLPTSADITNVDTTAWGRVSTQQSIVFAFDNNPDSREYQDIGYDGLSDADERGFFSDYLNTIQGVVTPDVFNQIQSDPSNDNYHYFRGSDYDDIELSILERYKNYNGSEGNSPTSEQSPESYPTAATTIPNNEDINRDYTLNEAENYFQYRINLYEGMDIANHKYIVDKVEDNSGIEGAVTWYQFRVPIRQYDSKVGEIYDFKSIRFMRMLLKNFSDSVILRFASLDLVRGQWRKYIGGLREPGAYFPSNSEGTEFEITAVNIEENGNKEPVNYVLPPETNRQIDPSNPNQQELNEQAMVYTIKDLGDGDAKAAYKNSNLDIRQYKKLEMFVHAEQIEGTVLKDKDVSAFIRLGSDFTENYYEYEIPLVLTPEGKYSDSESDRLIVWPNANKFDFFFSELTNAKKLRNAEGSVTQEFVVHSGDKRITVKGNPTISDVRTVMIGVRNPKQANNSLPDDGASKSVEVWFNELRLSEFDEEGGWAANMRVAANLADFANVSLSGAITRPGFGSLEKKISERNQDNIYEYDIASNFSLGKFFPEKSGIMIPMYVGYSKNIIVPKYNPLQPDLTMQETLDNPNVSDAEKDRISKIAKDQTTRKSINFTNVKVKKGKSKPKIYSISNWSATYAYSKIEKSNVTTAIDNESLHRGVLTYNYSPKPLKIEPFKKAKSKFMRSSAMRLIKDFNFSPYPKQISFMTDMNRRYHEKQARVLSTDDIRVRSTYDKDWQWNRKYDLRWDLTRSLKLTFNANNIARIDEPDGAIDKSDENYAEKRRVIEDELKSWGTTKRYNHSYNLNYNVPINKIPLLSWISSSVRYGGDYYWDAEPKVKADSLRMGNQIRNSRNLQVNAQANLKSLYNKVTYFKNLERKYNKTSRKKKRKEKENVFFPKKKKPAKKINLKKDERKVITHKLGTDDVSAEVKDGSGKVIKGKLEILSKNKIAFIPETTAKNATIRITGNISVSYSSSDQTVLPAYARGTKIMGMQGTAPGMPFIFGHQDEDFLQKSIDNDWLRGNKYQTSPYTMIHDENVSVRSNFEPFKGFRIDLTATRRESKDFTQPFSYDDITETFSRPEDLSYREGSYSISINTLGSAFETMGDDYTSDAFERFKANRANISKLYGEERSSALGNTPNPNASSEKGYADGYGQLSQDVLIHAFYSAYTNTNPDKMDITNHFYGYLAMFPGWRLSYDGLSKIRLVKKFFRSVKLNHSYQSTYNMGNFRTNSDFMNNPHKDIFSYETDVNGNYFPEYDMQSVSISEQFSPLISFDMTMKNSLNFKVEFKRSRNLTLNIGNSQVTEVKSQEYIFGAGYRFKSVTFKTKTREIKSDLNVRLDLSMRDNLTIIRRIIEDAHQVTAGKKIFTLKLNADYNLSKNFNVRFFFDWIRNKPRVSNLFKTSNINFGLSVRFSLM